jgi:glycosyltransferase involved in cell wall biosynthesis
MRNGRLQDPAIRDPHSAIKHLHAHFAHDPTLIAMLAHMLTGIPYSFTAHARDLYQVPEQELIRRVETATAVVTCCAVNVEYLSRVLPEPLRRKVHLIHHGVDLRNFRPSGATGSPLGRDGAETRPYVAHPQMQASAQQSASLPPPLILSAGRLVEKKGFPGLLEACALLKRAGYRFRCEIYGEGPMREQLLAEIGQSGLSDEVALPGAVTQQELLPVLQQADIFALTPFVTDDGDRDGVPNVLVEAMACGLPVVSTRVAGVPELVEHDCNGLLTEPHDVQGIAAALASLLEDVMKRKRLGEAARRTVIERFDLDAGAGRLAALFAPRVDPELEGSHAH